VLLEHHGQRCGGPRPHPARHHQDRRWRAGDPDLPAARDALLEHVMERPPAGPTAPVFATRTGGRQRPDNLRSRILAPAVARANELLARDSLPPIAHLTPHSMRRTFASLLAYCNVPMPRAMYLLGHDDPTMTVGIYQQMLNEGPGSVDAFEKLAGATRDEAETVLRGASIPTPFRPPGPEKAPREGRRVDA